MVDLRRRRSALDHGIRNRPGAFCKSQVG
jgi:hypothetical protein